MRSYREHQENEGYDTLFINGFLESTTEKMILDAIINDFVQTTSTSPKKSKSDLSQIDTIMNFYRKDDAPLLFIFINNIESGGLSKSFYTLSKLVALDKIKLICSVDKVSFCSDRGFLLVIFRFMVGLFLIKISIRHLNFSHSTFQLLNHIQLSPKLFKVFSRRVLLKLVRTPLYCCLVTKCCYLDELR